MNEVLERVKGMTMEARRARLREIDVLTASGDYSWSYDEYLRLREWVPEIAESDRRFMQRRMRKLA